jgi:glucose-6-phosphate-specific signal transduction histidine kinase
MTGMRQRVKEFGGVLRLENTNPGTRVEITLPSSSLLQPEPGCTVYLERHLAK